MRDNRFFNSDITGGSFLVIQFQLGNLNNLTLFYCFLFKITPNSEIPLMIMLTIFKPNVFYSC